MSLWSYLLSLLLSALSALAENKSKYSSSYNKIDSVYSSSF